MRDYVLTAFILGTLPFILRRPWIGVLMWAWIGVMNPHRLTWGFAYEMQFALYTAIATFAGMLFWKGHKHLPWTPATITLGAFYVWMHVTLLGAFDFQASLDMYDKVFKIFLMLFVTLYLLHSKQHIQWLVFILTVSVAYYGVKGGRFTLLGGGERVWGPGGSFIEDNNALAVAVIMTIPLLRYWQLQLKKTWQKLALVPLMLLCAISALGSQSRGALLAIVAMTALLWLKGRNKLLMAVLILVVAPPIYNFMPASWHQRMSTIETYDEDGSAMGRLDAWQGAFHMANDRLLGGGFGIYNMEALGKYTPSRGVRAMHSIWFQVLGEHGWIGLVLFVLIWVLVWRDAAWIIRRCGKREEFSWAADLARMIQVSLIGYLLGGALLQLAYWDFPYYLLIAMVLTRRLIEQQTEKPQKGWHPSANRAGTGSRGRSDRRLARTGARWCCARSAGGPHRAGRGATPVAASEIRLSMGPFSRCLSILIYHRVVPEPDPLMPGEVCAREFDWQMAVLARWFKVLPLREAVSRLREGRLPARAACVTFDDGYANNAGVALPVLRRHGVPATFFIATAFLDGGRMFNDTVIETVRRARGTTLDGRGAGLDSLPIATDAERRLAIDQVLKAVKYLPQDERERRVEEVRAAAAADLPSDLMMTAGEVRRLHENGMEIGAHTATHPILANLDATSARDEILDGRRRLEAITGVTVRLFAYPNGRPDVDYRREHVALVRDLGFDAAVSTAVGVATGASDPFQLPRFTPWDRTPARFTLRLLQNTLRTTPERV